MAAILRLAYPSLTLMLVATVAIALAGGAALPVAAVGMALPLAFLAMPDLHDGMRGDEREARLMRAEAFLLIGTTVLGLGPASAATRVGIGASLVGYLLAFGMSLELARTKPRTRRQRKRAHQGSSGGGSRAKRRSRFYGSGRSGCLGSGSGGSGHGGYSDGSSGDSGGGWSDGGWFGGDSGGDCGCGDSGGDCGGGDGGCGD